MAGAWQIPWLIGLTIISWIGNYPVADQHAGNLGLLNLESGVIVIAIFSALIMWMAQAFRLRHDRVVENINQEAAEAGGTADAV